MLRLAAARSPIFGVILLVSAPRLLYSPAKTILGGSRMHLQSLELFGFKSFADKTLFNFHEGLTPIVRPDGFGKSNFVRGDQGGLGGQDGKSLPGRGMADGIFHRTDHQQAHSITGGSVI